MTTSVLLLDVEVDGHRTAVRCRDEVVHAVSPTLRPTPADLVVSGRGGALLPGLHDHHLHLLAAAAALDSVDCGPGAVRGREDLGRALRRPGGEDEWVRGVGYHESVAGELDRRALDLLAPDRPVRVQHRSGALWMLNSRALERVAAVIDSSADVERDSRGEPTGRFWRYDARLRSALPSHPPDLAGLGRRLTSLGITGVTDATPDLDQASAGLIAAALERGELLVRVTALGAAQGTTTLPLGPRKLVLSDHSLPSYDDLLRVVSDTRLAGRPVAVHCVTRESLLLMLAVLDEVGALPGDRIEHAAVVPPGTAARMASLDLAVVTQPDFLRTRGDTYLRDVSEPDRPLLYPFASLVAAGVRVAASSDAPYGTLDPWQVVRSAVERRTAAGRAVAAEEAVPAATALAGYLSDPSDPGGRVRAVRPGSPADLCLLGVPLRTALLEPTAEHVRGVLFRGRFHPARS